MNQQDLLDEFKLRLTIKRTTMNQQRARMAAVSELAGCDNLEERLSARVAEMLETRTGYEHLTDLWESSIMDAGVDYLQRCLHLQPIKVHRTGSQGRHYVLDMDVRPENVYRDGSSRLGSAAAGSVGLFGEALAATVYTWMQVHGVTDPLAPWRYEAAARGITIAEPKHARWSVRFGSTRRETWHSMPVNASLFRLLDRNPNYSAELDTAATLTALKPRT